MIDELLNICRRERSIHPQAQWIDYYKLCLQSCYGAGHADPDPIHAKQYIDHEFVGMDREYLPLIQPLRLNGDIIRISLSVLDTYIRERFPFAGSFDSDFLANAFCNSAQLYPLDMTLWLEIWREVSTRLKTLIQPSPEETESLDSIIKSRHIPSHSAIYKTFYDPHYRVIITDTLKPRTADIIKLITRENDQ